MATLKLVTDPVYQLTLSRTELEVINQCMRSVGGHPNKTRRVHADAILKATREHITEEQEEDMPEMTGALYYK